MSALSTKLPLNLLQTQWASTLNPILSNPTNNASILKNISLTAGTNVINHLLGQKLQGWSIVRLRGPSTPVTLTTDWINTTFTSSWTTNTTTTGKYRLTGTDMECQVLISLTGAPDNTNLTINLPSGFMWDTSSLVKDTTSTSSFFNSSGSHGSGGLTLYTVYNGTSGVLIAYQSSITAGGTAVSQTTPVTWGSGDYIVAMFKGPIVGQSLDRSSFVQMYDIQDSNSNPDKTLLLVSSGIAVVDLLVF